MAVSDGIRRRSITFYGLIVMRWLYRARFTLLSAWWRLAR